MSKTFSKKRLMILFALILLISIILGVISTYIQATKKEKPIDLQTLINSNMNFKINLKKFSGMAISFRHLKFRV